MAEMNGRMNGAQFFPPPAFCLRFPTLQACREDLPLVLQKPDNFPLVMGILQEINHEKVGFHSQVDSAFEVLQRPRDQQTPMHALSKVKLENLEAEDQHQPSCGSNPDLYQEWSLKGVEELLTDSEEFRLRIDCYYQQDHEAAENLGLSLAQEEKPLFGLHSTRSSGEALLHVDEKLALCSRLPSSLEEPVPFQGRASPMRDLYEAHPGLIALEAAVLANNKNRHQQALACVEDSFDLDILRLVKREPDVGVCQNEAEMQDLPAECKSMSSDGEHAKENTGHMTSKQSTDKLTSNADAEANKKRRKVFPEREDLIAGLCEEGEALMNLKDKLTKEIDHESKNHMKTLVEPDLQLNLETGVTKRWTTHNTLRTTNAILAVSAEFTEEEKIQVPLKPPSTSNSLMAKGPICCVVSSKGADSQQFSIDFNGDQKHSVVLSEADHPDFCELTLGFGSSQPATTMCPKILDCHSLHERKSVPKSLFMQEEHHGERQRTNPNQWQQATRCASPEFHSTPAYNEKAPFSSTKYGCKLGDCCADGERSTRVVRTTLKTSSLYDSSSDEMPKRTCLFKEGHPSAFAGNYATVRKGSLDSGVSREALQVMSQSSEDEDTALEKVVVEEKSPEDDQLAESNPKIGEGLSNLQACQVHLQSKLASEVKEPDKKRMRGTLPMQEKEDGGQHKEKDTRCHRSDGKSWRCVRECINGAYYCQYHLRARRIGYSRRKNRDTEMNPIHESGRKKSLKSGQKSRQPLSTSN